MDFEAINRRITNCSRNATADHVVQGSCHSLMVLFDCFSTIKGQKTCQTLRKRACFNHCRWLLKHFRCRLSRHEDIFIVWQENDIARIDLVNSLDKVLCRRVHSLTTRNDIVHALSLEDFSKAVTSYYRDNSVFFFFSWLGSFFFLLKLGFVLVTHVVHFYLDKATILQSFLHDKTWIFCMDVHFHDFIIINYQQGIPKLIQIITEFIIVKVLDIGWSLLQGYHDFCTITKSDVFCRHMACYRFVVFSIDHLSHRSRSRLEIF